MVSPKTNTVRVWGNISVCHLPFLLPSDESLVFNPNGDRAYGQMTEYLCLKTKTNNKTPLSYSLWST